MSFPRVTPSFLVAVVALVVASGGAGFAAGQITSTQIKDGTIQSRDVRDRGLTGVDVKDRSLPRTKIATGCRSTEIRVAGGCVSKASSVKRVSYSFATTSCAKRNGRLPTVGELFWLQTQPGFVFGSNGPGDSEFEFSSDYISSRDEPFTPMGVERGSVDNYVPNASALLFHFHCVTF